MIARLLTRTCGTLHGGTFSSSTIPVRRRRRHRRGRSRCHCCRRNVSPTRQPRRNPTKTKRFPRRSRRCTHLPIPGGGNSAPPRAFFRSVRPGFRRVQREGVGEQCLEEFRCFLRRCHLFHPGSLRGRHVEAQALQFFGETCAESERTFMSGLKNSRIAAQSSGAGAETGSASQGLRRHRRRLRRSGRRGRSLEKGCGERSVFPNVPCRAEWGGRAAQEEKRPRQHGDERFHPGDAAF